MPCANLSVRLPESTWISRISRDNPDAVFRVLAAMPRQDHGVGLVEISASDMAPIMVAMDESDAVVSLDMLEAGEQRAIIQFETTEPLLLLSVRQAGVPLELPVSVRDGEAAIEVTASRDRLSRLASTLDSFGMSFELESIYETSGPDDLLTDRQRRLLVAAVERGYYDTPRRCSLTDLAEHQGIAKSTASETLHRAEETVVKQFVGRLAGLDIEATAGQA